MLAEGLFQGPSYISQKLRVYVCMHRVSLAHTRGVYVVEEARALDTVQVPFMKWT